MRSDIHIRYIWGQICFCDWWTDRQTDICNCRVAFATEEIRILRDQKSKRSEIQEIRDLTSERSEIWVLEIWEIRDLKDQKSERSEIWKIRDLKDQRSERSEIWEKSDKYRWTFAIIESFLQLKTENIMKTTLKEGHGGSIYKEAQNNKHST